MPQPEPQERRQEDHEARGNRRFTGRAIDGIVLGPQVEQLMEESEIDAEVGQHRPRDERGCRKDDLVIGGENGRQKDREQARQAEHRAVEQLAVAGFDFVVDRLPQIDAGKPLGRKFGDVGDRLAGLQRDAEHVGLVAFDALRHEADRRRNGFDTARIKIGPDRAGAADRIAVGRQPALHRLVGLVGEREHHPIGIGARHRRAHRHAAGYAIGACRRFNLQTVAAALVSIAERCDFDALEIGLHDDRRHRLRPTLATCKYSNAAAAKPPSPHAIASGCHRSSCRIIVPPPR